MLKVRLTLKRYFATWIDTENDEHGAHVISTQIQAQMPHCVSGKILISMSSIFCILHFLYFVFLVFCISCILYVLYFVFCISCILYFLHFVFLAFCISCILYFLYFIFCISCILYFVFQTSFCKLVTTKQVKQKTSRLRRRYSQPTAAGSSPSPDSPKVTLTKKSVLVLVENPESFFHEPLLVLSDVFHIVVVLLLALESASLIGWKDYLVSIHDEAAVKYDVDDRSAPVFLDDVIDSRHRWRKEDFPVRVLLVVQHGLPKFLEADQSVACHDEDDICHDDSFCDLDTFSMTVRWQFIVFLNEGIKWK